MVKIIYKFNLCCKVNCTIGFLFICQISREKFLVSGAIWFCILSKFTSEIVYRNNSLDGWEWNKKTTKKSNKKIPRGREQKSLYQMLCSFNLFSGSRASQLDFSIILNFFFRLSLFLLCPIFMLLYCLFHIYTPKPNPYLWCSSSSRHQPWCDFLRSFAVGFSIPTKIFLSAFGGIHGAFLEYKQEFWQWCRIFALEIM